MSENTQSQPPEAVKQEEDNKTINVKVRASLDERQNGIGMSR
jgi:hypothetical protein